MSIVSEDEIQINVSDRVDPLIARHVMLDRWVTSTKFKSERARRRRKLAVYFLSLNGWSYSQIGSAMRIDKATVCRYIEYVQEALEQYFLEINFHPEDMSSEQPERMPGRLFGNN